LVRSGDRVVWIYHPKGESIASTAKPAAAPAPAPVVAPQPAPAVAAKAAINALDAGELLKLSPAEMRSRALKIDPYKTAWIGRVDTIPPASDERTSLIDRGLILRGFFTEEEIAEIHRIGDLWMEHKGSAQDAYLRTLKKGEDAVAKMRAEREALKQQK